MPDVREIAAPLLSAQAQGTPPAPVSTDDGFPIGIHLITIPLVLLFGIFLGWALRERKLANDEARREAAGLGDAQR